MGRKTDQTPMKKTPNILPDLFFTINLHVTIYKVPPYLFLSIVQHVLNKEVLCEHDRI